MAESEALSCYGRGDTVGKMQRQQATFLVTFLDHAKCTAGCTGSNKILHELPVDGELGQRGVTSVHGSLSVLPV
jgi:hypothetical protein